MKIIDPNKLDDFPYFVFSGDMRGFMGWGIKMRTNSSWNHSMIMHRQGYFASQGWLYKEVPLKAYMKKHIILKFWKCTDITPVERMLILGKIDKELSQPWWKRRYDYLGVLGQFLGFRWINAPYLKYCSERVRSKIKKILPKIKEHPTPEDIDQAFKKSPRMEVLGFWLHPDV